MPMSRKNKNEANSQPVQKKAVSKTVNEVKTTVQPTKEQVETNRRLDELNQLRVTTQTVLPPVKSVISIDGVPFFELDDIGALKAKQKAGKTTTLKVLTGTWMKGELFRLKSELKEAKVLWIDTEQKQADVKQIVDDVVSITDMDKQYIDSHLKLYSVRTLSYKTLLQDTELLVRSYRPHVLIIDGLVDFAESFNDEAQSHTLINALVKMSDDYHCAIISVLHENKSSDDHNMRGHLGTMLSQKAGTVLACKKDANNVITVSCSDSRHRAMPDWKIMYDENGNIISADGNLLTPAQQEKQKRIDVIKKTIQDNGGDISRKELTEKIQESFKLSRSAVSNLISDLIKNGTLCDANGKVSVMPELSFLN